MCGALMKIWTRKTTEASLSTYDPPFWSFALISCEHGAQNHRKLCHLNFDGGFELGDLVNPRI